MSEQQVRHPGRRVTDLGGDGGLTFPVAISKSAIWLLGSMLAVTGSLLAYLCLASVDQGKILSRMDERSQITTEDLKAIKLTNARLSLEVKHLQILAAQHGWKESPEMEL